MTSDDRMSINAAIGDLLDDPNDVEAADVIIKFGSALPKSNFLTLDINMGGGKSNKLSGHTAEHGNVTINSDSKNEKNLLWGMQKERVGYYKIWKEREGVLALQYFWKSDLSTEGVTSPPPLYHLAYKSKTLKFIDFAVRRRVVLLSIGWLHFVTVMNDSLRQPGKSTFQEWSLVISNVRP